MSKQREVPGLADAMALIVGPVLITTMIVALAYFLVEVFYGGEYSGRMRWTLFFYIMGCVLVARLAIEFGSGRSSLYALVLGGATFLAMQRFVNFPPGWMEQLGPLINVGLLALVWWWARQLTWDCTHIDPDRDASDRGVLEAAGLEQGESTHRNAERPEPVAEDAKAVEHGGILRRFQRWREQRRKKAHTPGVWVVYFALAALPIFGLGQALIPVEHRSSRIFSFYMMVLYVASAMGLLMSTAFLGLRRYVHDKNLEIPPKIASLWLGLGSAMIGGFLLIAALLPRPASETALIDVSRFVGSEQREASDHAIQRDGAGKGDGTGGEQSSEKAESSSAASGKSEQTGRGSGDEQARKGSGEKKGQGGDSGKSDQKGNQNGGKQQGDAAGKKDQSPQRNDRQTTDRSSSRVSSSDTRTSDRAQVTNRRSEARRPSSSLRSLGALDRVGPFIKWLVFALLVVIVVFFLVRQGLTILAQFSDWAKGVLNFWQRLWAKLFGGSEPVTGDDVVEDFANFDTPSTRFADFPNPFESGQAYSWSNEQLVRHAFAALEAWAWEAGYPREMHETPLEFAQRLGRDRPTLQRTAPAVAVLYARLAYSRKKLPDSSRDQVKELWQDLETLAVRSTPATAK